MHQPKSVTILPDAVHIQWDDGKECAYAHRDLRGECPCAHCVHELTGKRMVGRDQVTATVEALDWLTIGRYAIQFLWSDGHQTGLYPYNLLRELCTRETRDGAKAEKSAS